LTPTEGLVLHLIAIKITFLPVDVLLYLLPADCAGHAQPDDLLLSWNRRLLFMTPFAKN